MQWAHPVRGPLSPDAFLPLAEELGLGASLGLWLLEGACRSAAAWSLPLKLVVSLSPRQFAAAGELLEAVAQTVQATGLAAERLELQLPDTLLHADCDQQLDHLQALKALGVRLSLADFGRGLTAFEALRQPWLDGISLDSRVVTHLERQHADAAIAQALIGLGRTLGLKVAATDVETPGQLHWLQTQHCDEVQGALVGHALSASELTALLDTELRAG
jgi:EAL domain-containing protein (putative c-di-GMP-specific phosphodiesterase class I)